MSRGALFIATAILLSGACHARAGLIDFNIDASHPAGASLGYAGGANPLVAGNLSVDSVIGLDVPLNDGSILNLTGGRLNFQTGNLTGSDASHWSFGAGGWITITTSSAIVPGASDVLLTGAFKSADVEIGSGAFKVVIASYANVVDDQLAGYYGIAPGLAWDGDLNISFMATGSPPDGFQSSRVLSGDVVAEAVPEPSSLLMGSIGVLGLGLFAARRRGR
jgi:hypothetical protein